MIKYIVSSNTYSPINCLYWQDRLNDYISKNNMYKFWLIARLKKQGYMIKYGTGGASHD